MCRLVIFFSLEHVDSLFDICLGCSVEGLAENIFRTIRVCEILIFHVIGKLCTCDMRTQIIMIVGLALLSEELLK